jgi:DNA-binding SARP family transcriptional activator
VVEILAGSGNHRAAAAHYKSLHPQLTEDLDVEPAESKKFLGARIRQGELLPADVTVKPASQDRVSTIQQSPIRLEINPRYYF